MDVKEAVKAAKEYVTSVFADEKISNLGLEEVEQDEYGRIWRVTLGFSRPWDRVINPLVGIALDQAPARAYRVVTIRDEDGAVTSVKLRE